MKHHFNPRKHSTQSPTSHASQQFTVSFLFPRFWHTTHRLCGLAFFSEGGSLLIKCLSVSRGTVLSEKNVGLAPCVPAHLHTSQTFLQLTEFWMTADQFFSPSCFCILSWHSKLKYSEACEIASYTICSFAFSQSNKSAAAGLSSQPHPCIGCCNPTLKWVWLFPCL
jgi:hypothetical protein